MQNLKSNVKLILFSGVIVTISIVLSNYGYAETIWEKRANKAQEAISPEPVSVEEAITEEIYDNTIDASSIIIPEQYGSIVETYDKGTNGKLIIHIQDAHANYEAQINEANILESLINDYNLNLILKESKLTDRDFKYLRPRLPLEERKEVADGLLRDGYITGVNYLDLGSDYPTVIQGLEDKELYDSNRNAMWEIDKFKDLAGEYVDKLIIASNGIKPHIYNKDLIALDNKKNDYESENIDLIAYYSYALQSFLKTPFLYQLLPCKTLLSSINYR